MGKSIQSQVSKLLTNEPTLTLHSVLHRLPKANLNTVRSCYRRFKKDAPKYASDASNDRITMDLVEKLIIEGKTPIPLLRVMTDFLKVKSQDHSELEEIDMTLFYEKAMLD